MKSRSAGGREAADPPEPTGTAAQGPGRDADTVFRNRHLFKYSAPIFMKLETRNTHTLADTYLDNS